MNKGRGLLGMMRVTPDIHNFCSIGDHLSLAEKCKISTNGPIDRGYILCIVAGMKHPVTERREELGLTKTQFAKEVDVAPLTVTRWEEGQTLPQRRYWNKLKELGVALDRIFSEAGA
jgi:DNA-binding XRE family transcriptional regulator